MGKFGSISLHLESSFTMIASLSIKYVQRRGKGCTYIAHSLIITGILPNTYTALPPFEGALSQVSDY